MKKYLTLLFFLAMTSIGLAQSNADSLLYAPLDSTASRHFVLGYPAELTIWWNRWAAIGAQVDTLFLERYTNTIPLQAGQWVKTRLYNELTGEYDTLIVRDRPVSVVVPIHAVPTLFRINSLGRQTDTVKVLWRW